MITKTPYFLTNPKWYYFDDKEWKYKLTDEATDKAKQSYDTFYKRLEKYG